MDASCASGTLRPRPSGRELAKTRVLRTRTCPTRRESGLLTQATGRAPQRKSPSLPALSRLRHPEATAASDPALSSPGLETAVDMLLRAARKETHAGSYVKRDVPTPHRTRKLCVTFTI